jgi:hypothetical protein
MTFDNGSVTVPEFQLARSVEPCIIRATRMVYFFAALRLAQYFRIRSPTAFRCAAVIFRLRRLAPVAAALRAPLLRMKFTGNSSSSTEALRSGNIVRICFASSANSRSLAFAP